MSAADVVRFESLVHEGTEFAQNKLRENKEIRDALGGSRLEGRPLAFDAGDGEDDQLLALALEDDRADVSREQQVNRDFDSRPLIYLATLSSSFDNGIGGMNALFPMNDAFIDLKLQCFQLLQDR